MIKAIVAIDEQRGMANDKGIPWDLPSDRKYFRDQTMSGAILMGYGTYVEFASPFQGRKNYVASTKDEPMRPGFEQVKDAAAFLHSAKENNEDVWVIGGAGLFTATLPLIEQLFITQLTGTYDCTKFFPEFTDQFELTSETPFVEENGIRFTFQVWKRK